MWYLLPCGWSEYARKHKKKAMKLAMAASIPAIPRPEKPHIKLNNKPAWLGRRK